MSHSKLPHSNASSNVNEVNSGGSLETSSPSKSKRRRCIFVVVVVAVVAAGIGLGIGWYLGNHINISSDYPRGYNISIVLYIRFKYCQ